MRYQLYKIASASQENDSTPRAGNISPDIPRCSPQEDEDKGVDDKTLSEERPNVLIKQDTGVIGTGEAWVTSNNLIESTLNTISSIQMPSYEGQGNQLVQNLNFRQGTEVLR